MRKLVPATQGKFVKRIANLPTTSTLDQYQSCGSPPIAVTMLFMRPVLPNMTYFQMRRMTRDGTRIGTMKRTRKNADNFLLLRL